MTEKVLFVGRSRDDDPVARLFCAQAGVEPAGWAAPDSDDLEDHIADSDIVVSRVDPQAQPQLAARALAAGRSVWLRQPLAADDRGLRELDQAVTAARGIVGVDSRVFATPVADAAHAIAAAKIGIPFAVHYDVVGDGFGEGIVDEALGAVLYLLPGLALDVFASATSTPDGPDCLTITLGIGANASATLIIAPVHAIDHEELRLRGTKGSLTTGRGRRQAGPNTTSSAEMSGASAVAEFLAVVRGDRPRLSQDYRLARLAHHAANAVRRSAADNASIQINDQDQP